MVWKTRNPAKDGKVLSEALKAVRRHRGLLAQDVAKAMNMPLRTYQHFESGRARINLDHIVRFANATNSDPLAILVSVWTGSAPFARLT
jgi:transcriptional regulator with XRE-family HTH domain